MRIQINDPVLRKRLVIGRSAPPFKKLLMAIGLIVIGIGGAIAYFFPNKLNEVNHSSGVENKTQPVESKTSPTVEIQLPVPPNPPKTVSGEPPPLLHPSDPKTPFSSEEKTLPKEVPPAPAKVAETPPPVQPNPNSATEISLFTRVQEQITKQRFTSPPGDNAYETYQALLKIGSPQAQTVLDAIVTWYAEQGQKLVSKDKLTQPEHGNAYEMYQRMKEIAPQHPNTQALLNDIIKHATERMNSALKNNKLLGSDIDKVYDIYQDLQTVMSKSSETQRFLDKILDKLFERAQQQIIQQKYTTPRNDNAADTYQKILQISPHHPQAQQGIETLADKYYQFALSYQKRGHLEYCMKQIEIGLQISPNHSKLLQLKKEISEKPS